MGLLGLAGNGGAEGSGGGGGGVSSVGLSLPSDFDVSGSPVTGSGILAVTRAGQLPNTVLAGPTSSPGGAAGTPGYRTLDFGDLPGMRPAPRPVGIYLPQYAAYPGLAQAGVQIASGGNGTLASAPYLPPPYLQAFNDPISGMRVRRITSVGWIRTYLGLTGIVGANYQLGTNFKVHHAYSSLQAWNADGSLILMTYDGGSQNVIVDGITGAPIRVLGSGYGSNGNPGSFPMWDEIDPNLIWSTYEVAARLVHYKLGPDQNNSDKYDYILYALDFKSPTNAGTSQGVNVANSPLRDANMAAAWAPTGQSIGSVTVVGGGSGYTQGAAVTASGGGGSGFTGTANVTSGAITSVTITNGGQGYTSTPTLSAAGGTGASLTPVLGVTLQELAIGGNGGAGGLVQDDGLEWVMSGFACPANGLANWKPPFYGFLMQFSRSAYTGLSAGAWYSYLEVPADNAQEDGGAYFPVRNVHMSHSGRYIAVNYSTKGNGGNAGAYATSSTAITAGQTTANVPTLTLAANGGSAWPTVSNGGYGVMYVLLEPGTANEEYVPITAATATALTVQSGYTFARSHSGTYQVMMCAGTWLYCVADDTQRIMPGRFDTSGSFNQANQLGVPVQLTSLISHEDWAYDTLDNEVLLVQGQMSSDATGAYSLPAANSSSDSWCVAFRADGQNYSSGPWAGKSWFVPIAYSYNGNVVNVQGGHCSGRANRRPGYALFSTQSMVTTGSSPNITASPTTPLNDAVFSVALDPTVSAQDRLVELWAVGSNQQAGSGMALEATCDRDMTAVLFNSDWRFNGNTDQTYSGTISTPNATGIALAAGGSLTVGTTYYYKVAASTTPDQSVPTKAGVPTTLGETFAAASSPTSVTPTTGNQSVTHTFPTGGNIQNGQTHWSIYRSTAVGGPYGWIADVTVGTATWTDTGAVTPSTTRTAETNNTSYIAEIFDHLVTAR